MLRSRRAQSLYYPYAPGPARNVAALYKRFISSAAPVCLFLADFSFLLPKVFVQDSMKVRSAN
jgi:hypothetical protein